MAASSTARSYCKFIWTEQQICNSWIFLSQSLNIIFKRWSAVNNWKIETESQAWGGQAMQCNYVYNEVRRTKGLLFSHISALCYSLTYSLTRGAQQSGEAVHSRVTHCHKACNDQKCNTTTRCALELHSNKPLCITVSDLKATLRTEQVCSYSYTSI